MAVPSANWRLELSRVTASSLRLPPPLWGRSVRTRSARTGRGPPQGETEPLAARLSLKSLGKRAVLAGIAWGGPMTALFVALEVWHCGVLCLTDAVVTLAMATIGGILTIGMFAAWFGGTEPGFTSRRNLSQKGTSWLASSS
jgi:hypothetical protein